MRLKILVVFVAGLSLIAGLASVNAQPAAGVVADTMTNNFNSIQSLPAIINGIKPPVINNPEWLQSEIDAEIAASKAVAQAKLVAAAAAEAAKAELAKQSMVITVNKNVTYDVSTRGIITADLTEFKSLASQTYNDSRGWSQLGVSFQEVADNGDFTLVLSEASQLPSFSSICSVDWSCRVGRYVVINQDRWLYATDAWNNAGGSLRDYRNMVINHETGHWLGHGHATCGGSGQSAPVMQQQSIDLAGCNFNPWPLASELWSSQLGI